MLVAQVGHRAENLPAGEGVELVYSSAVGAENPERVAARERGMAELTRADLLGELSALRRTIAVAGTHGKTTTSSMIAHALLGRGACPGWLIGAPIGGGLANADWGEGEWLVIEADESDRSLLSLKVEIAVLTNVELDHHASFASLAELRELFRTFLRRRAAGSRPRPPGAAGAPQRPERRLRGAGSRGSRPGARASHGRVARSTLRVPGAHNATDAAGALEAARLAGVAPGVAADGAGVLRGGGPALSVARQEHRRSRAL